MGRVVDEDPGFKSQTDLSEGLSVWSLNVLLGSFPLKHLKFNNLQLFLLKGILCSSRNSPEVCS